MRPFKLYSMVWLTMCSPHAQGRTYKVIGQVMSMRTPEGTYMVRTVPGHPGTLRETSECNLEPATGRYTSVSYATVNGRGQFPVDMLRYDNCAPVNFEVLETATGPKGQLLPGMGDLFIVAKACGPREPASWTPARWNSFLWGITIMGEHGIDE